MEEKAPARDITELLLKSAQGDPQALEEIFPIVYPQLRAVAANYMRRERADHTLQPTALVHEAYFRLLEQKSVVWQNRSHFFAVTAKMMRRILLDYSRGKKALKRGGSDTRVAFEEAFHWNENEKKQHLDLEAALESLGEVSPRQEQIVELRYFAGLSIEQTAEAMQLSVNTVKRDWALAKAYLYRILQKDLCE